MNRMLSPFQLRVLLVASLATLFSFGGANAFAGDKEDIVGRWDLVGSKDLTYIRFNADGTFKDVCLFLSNEGNYKLPDGATVELDVPGTFYGRVKSEVKYQLKGDSLKLKVAGTWQEYSRAK